MSKVVPLFFDRLRNLAANIGTGRDKITSSHYHYEGLTDAQLMNAYRGNWLPRKLIDIPASDATRRWREWQGTKEQIDAIEEVERRFAIRKKLKKVLQLSRLKGGGAILIGDGSPNPLEPIDLDNFRGLKYVTLLSRADVNPGDFDFDPSSEFFRQPKFWQINTQDRGMLDVHPTRLCLFKGNEIPDDHMHAQNGWGDSVLDAVYSALMQADSTTANIASMIFEGKVDVIKIPGLMAQIGDEQYFNRLTTRLTSAMTLKGVNGALIMDKEEEYDQKRSEFANLHEIMDRFFQNVAGAADIPLTRLFGRSAGGLNATGESDLKNYYDMIQSIQETEITPTIWRLDEAIIREALGERPDNIFYNWRGLWQLNDKERSEVTKNIADAGTAMLGYLAPEVVGEAVSNALIENGIMPGLQNAMEKAGEAAFDVKEPVVQEPFGNGTRSSSR